MNGGWSAVLSSTAGAAIIAVIGSIAVAYIQRVRGRSSRIDQAEVVQGMTLALSTEVREQLDDARNDLARTQSELTHIRQQMTELEGRFDQLLKRARDAEAENQVLRVEAQSWRDKYDSVSGGGM